ncbi:helix-turn-helix domain-containing protein [Rhodococcus qingshengii]|nr:helix-turn-helix domain-containing protein [Rhodococcus qingshengii]
MSDRPMNKFAWMEAIRGADLTHAEYRVLLNLSTFARGDLTNARPSLKTLCAAARVTDKTAKKSIRTLIEKGWIVRTHEGGRGTGRTNVFTLAVPKLLGGTECPPESGSLKGTDYPPESASREVIGAALGGHSVPPRGVIDAESGGYSLPPNQKEPSGTNNREGHPLSCVSNTGASAHERETEKAAQTKEPPSHANSLDRYGNEQQPEPEQTPMDHLRRTLGALSEDESTYAVDMIEWGHSWYAIRAELVKYRDKQRLGRRKTLHPPKDTSAPLNGAEIPTATAEKSTA